MRTISSKPPSNAEAGEGQGAVWALGRLLCPEGGDPARQPVPGRRALGRKSASLTAAGAVVRLLLLLMPLCFRNSARRNEQACWSAGKWRTALEFDPDKRINTLDAT